MEQLLKFEENIQTLQDSELLSQVGQLFQREKRVGDSILLGLKEINSRRLYAALGYSSLFDFLVKYYQLSESSAYTRINSLKLINTVPEAQEAIFKGEISLSNAAKVQSFFSRTEKENPLSIEEKTEVLNSIKGTTQKEADIILAELNPVAITPNLTQLQIMVDKETLTLLKEIKDLLSHQIMDGDYNKILKQICEISLEVLLKKKGRPSKKNNSSETPVASKRCVEVDEQTDAQTDIKIENQAEDSTESPTESSTPTEVSSDSPTRTPSEPNKHINLNRHIPIKIRRQVFARAEGRCEFVGTEGHRCNFTHMLELDHILSFSQGGTHDLANMRVTCKKHNLFRVKETHGYWY